MSDVQRSWNIALKHYHFFFVEKRQKPTQVEIVFSGKAHRKVSGCSPKQPEQRRRSSWMRGNFDRRGAGTSICSAACSEPAGDEYGAVCRAGERYNDLISWRFRDRQTRYGRGKKNPNCVLKTIGPTNRIREYLRIFQRLRKRSIWVH
jgi:hypothetical protein